MPLLMIKTVGAILQQAVTGGITCCILVNTSGAIITYAGLVEEEEAKTYAAIAANLWNIYSRNSNTIFLKHDDLTRLTAVCEKGTVYVTGIYPYFLCVVSEPQASPGLIKAKMDAIVRYLDPHIRELGEYLDNQG
ncbi:uncharacterized protein VTP21DRAFT_8399 [Calcarisporiella thermophila]|uniref:uncharacterized protein n=1 Tax=Calcarisporiella thermophila TaxID=911321 RepID=UPI003742B9E4